MKSAIIQLNATDDKKKNIDHALRLVLEAAKHHAKFICLPEVFNFRGLPQKNSYSHIAEPIPGKSTTPLMLFAKTHKVFILAGSVYEKVPGERRVYNTSVLINDKGKIAACYRKINLFDAVINERPIKESTFFMKGRAIKTARVGNFKIGMSICYDLRFPNLYQRYLKAGVHIICVPSCFTNLTGLAHWEALLRARAIESLSYVIAPNQIGNDARDITAFGNSLIIDPWGRVVARASHDKEQILYADINTEDLQRATALLPSIRK